MRWLLRRFQRSGLDRFFAELDTPLPELPAGHQEYDSDPLWQISHFGGDWYTRHEIRVMLANTVRERAYFEDVRLPVLSFFGSCGGKSGASSCLDQFAFEKLHEPSNEYSIGFETDRAWQTNIASYEGRFNHSWPDAYHFGWSDRLYLVNGDQSHHFAAIYRQAKTQKRMWHVPCNLRMFEFIADVEEGDSSPLFFTRKLPDDPWDYLRRGDLRLRFESVGRFDFELQAMRFVDVLPEVVPHMQALISHAEERGVVCRLRNLGRWWAASKNSLRAPAVPAFRQDRAPFEVRLAGCNSRN